MASSGQEQCLLAGVQVARDKGRAASPHGARAMDATSWRGQLCVRRRSPPLGAVRLPWSDLATRARGESGSLVAVCRCGPRKGCPQMRGRPICAL
eukprot:422912-Alexandrium_andersonii.AAC.1